MLQITQAGKGYRVPACLGGTQLLGLESVLFSGSLLPQVSVDRRPPGNISLVRHGKSVSNQEYRTTSRSKTRGARGALVHKNFESVGSA